ncbi:MAG: tetraacyldisaccharide 4'-kinase [Candidatus Abyssubacteria bacterium]
MNLESHFRIIAGEEQGLKPMAIRATLAVASGFYLLGYTARQAAYSLGFARSATVDAKVISIGNITAGGTGKTPATIYFARKLQEAGRRVVVLSRGYGRSSRMDRPLVVSDGAKTLVASREAGDEPWLIARKLTRTPVVVCADRIKGAEFAIERFRADTIVLDDGFQHIALKRDEDIVVLDCAVPFGYGHLLPRGLLREPLSALKRATRFLLTHADKYEHDETEARLRDINPTAQVLKSRHRPVKLISAKDGTVQNCASLSGRRVVVFSGIGNPKSFEDTIRRLGAQTVGNFRYVNHHWYDSRDIEAVIQSAKQSNADYIVTTEKDWVRLSLLDVVPENLFLLEIELELLNCPPSGVL